MEPPTAKRHSDRVGISRFDVLKRHKHEEQLDLKWLAAAVGKHQVVDHFVEVTLVLVKFEGIPRVLKKLPNGSTAPGVDRRCEVGGGVRDR
jgi:hypothetical protein